MENRETTPDLNEAQEPEVQATPTPRRTRTPAAPTRVIDDLLGIDPKKMTDTERINLIKYLLQENTLLTNKVKELDVGYQKLIEHTKMQDENFRCFVNDRNAKMQYVHDTMRMAYQSIKMASEG